MPKKKREEPELVNYAFRVDRRTYVIDQPDSSGEEFSYQGSTGLNYDIEKIYRPGSPVSGWKIEYLDTWHAKEVEDIEAGQPAYVISAHYQTGDTFGSSEQMAIMAVVSTPEKARDLKDKFDTIKSTGDSFGYPWVGYFERLIEIRIDSLIMLP